MRHPVGLHGLDQLDVRRSEENSINVCNFFLKEGGSCSYDDETVGDIDVPLRYQHLVKQWVPSNIPKVNTNFCVNERIYRIAPSLLYRIKHLITIGLGLPTYSINLQTIDSKGQ